MNHEHDRPSTINVNFRVDNDATERAFTAILNKLEAINASIVELVTAIDSSQEDKAALAGALANLKALVAKADTADGKPPT